MNPLGQLFLCQSRFFACLTDEDTDFEIGAAFLKIRCKGLIPLFPLFNVSFQITHTCSSVRLSNPWLEVNLYVTDGKGSCYSYPYSKVGVVNFY